MPHHHQQKHSSTPSSPSPSSTSTSSSTPQRPNAWSQRSTTLQKNNNFHQPTTLNTNNGKNNSKSGSGSGSRQHQHQHQHQSGAKIMNGSAKQQQHQQQQQQQRMKKEQQQPQQAWHQQPQSQPQNSPTIVVPQPQLVMVQQAVQQYPLEGIQEQQQINGNGPSHRQQSHINSNSNSIPNQQHNTFPQQMPTANGSSASVTPSMQHHPANPSNTHPQQWNPSNIHPHKWDHNHHMHHHHATTNNINNNGHHILHQEHNHPPHHAQQQQYPPTSPSSLPPLDTHKFSYEWDPQNAQRVMSTRASMLTALFSPDSTMNNNNSNSNNNNSDDADAANNNSQSQIMNDPLAMTMPNFARSQSENIPLSSSSTTTRPKSGSFARATSVGTFSGGQQPPPSLPNLNYSPDKQQRFNSKGGGQGRAGGKQSKQRQQQQLPQKQRPGLIPSNNGANHSNNNNNNSDSRMAPINENPPMNNTVLQTLNEMLPIPQTYFGCALRYLLMDSPLPLAGCAPSSTSNPSGINGGTSNNNSSNQTTTTTTTTTTIIQPRPPHPHETIYLLPRFWLVKWCLWARSYIVDSSSKHWFEGWRRFDAQQEMGGMECSRWMEHQDQQGQVHQQDPMHQQEQQTLLPQSKSNQEEHPKRTFTILPEASKALAALSILMDQYQLHPNDNETEWTAWLQNLETCWNDQLHHHHHHQQQFKQQQQQQQRQSGRNKKNTSTITSTTTSNNKWDEKKNEEGSSSSSSHHGKGNGNGNQHPAPPQTQTPHPPHNECFPFQQSPGPIDGRILSRRDRPLLMHQHVSLILKGLQFQSQHHHHDNNNSNSSRERNGNVLSIKEEMDEKKLCEFLDDIQTEHKHGMNAVVDSSNESLSLLGVCPVPANFYDWIRSSQGAICDDGDVSYAPSADGGVGIGGGGKGGQSSSSSSPSSLLFHDQWDHPTDNTVPSNEGRDTNVHNQGHGTEYHHYYFSNNANNNGGGSGNNNTSQSSVTNNHQHQQQASPVAKMPNSRPIEFRRRLLPVQIRPKGDSEDDDDDDDDNKAVDYLNAAKKGTSPSPYSKLMKEAMKSKKEGESSAVGNATNKKRMGNGLTVDTAMRTNDDGSSSEDVAYTVEVFPVEFRYVIVDGANPNPPSNNNNKSPTSSGNSNNKGNSATKKSSNYSRQGIALASRSSSAHDVLRDLERVAVPNMANACTRLWRKSPTFGNVDNKDDASGAEDDISGSQQRSTTSRRRGGNHARCATLKGDGYDLLDIGSLAPDATKVETMAFASPPKTPKSKGKMADSSKAKEKQEASVVPPLLTIEQWLGLQELTMTDQSSTNENGTIVVELLIEIRSSLTSKWVREPLELENRLQVGDYVDAQDSARKWYEAIVREITPDTIKVHYFGWGSKWDTALPKRKGSIVNSKLSPPVPLWTRSARWREQIKIGDEVEIRESTSLVQRPKWHRASVLAVGNENDVPRELEGGAELEVLEVDELGRRKPLMLLNRKRQILVEVPQEIHNCSNTTPLTPPRITKKDRDGATMPAAQPPYRRWVDLYSEEICKVKTHKTATKKSTGSPATLNYTIESKRPVVEVMKPFNNIHGSGFVRESLRGIPPAAGVVGLHNLGNSCYMNSILQCINHVRPITQYFLKGDYVKEVNKNNPLGSGGRVATAYSSYLNDIYSGDFSILAPRILKQTVGFYAPQFNNNYQHDSQEFCQYLMDGLHEDLNRVKDKPYVEQMEVMGMEDGDAAMESWKKHLLRHDSIFVDYTQGMHRSHLTCPSCGKESIKFDVYSSISLPLVSAKTGCSSIPLKACLDQFAVGEQLDEHNAWYCANCKKHVCALKLITLWNTPDVLVLHLKRFTFEKCPIQAGKLLRRKITDTVDFPIDRLDLSSYIKGPLDPDAPPIYKLFGVSEHTGTTANSGHYTATVRNSEDGNWYRYNDSHVGSTSGDAAVTGGAYLLFYQRVKGSLRWAGMEKQMHQAAQGNGNSSNTNGMPAGEDTDGFREVTGKKTRRRKP